MRSFARTLLVAVTLAAAVVLPSSPASAHPSRYNEYYDYYDVGKAQIPFHDSRWVPQGLTKYGENTLVVAYYDYYGTYNSRLALIDRASGAHRKTLYLNFKGHVGGLATTSKYLFVTKGNGVRIYNRSDLGKASGTTLTGLRDIKLSASSYAYGEGDNLWVGKFDKDHRTYMYRYAVSSTGKLTYKQRVYTPSQVQGVVVTGSRIVWAQSYGRTNDSKLIAWPRSRTYNGSASIGNFVTAPNMAEGMVIAGGQVQVVFESGAIPYVNGADGNGKADYVIRSVHHGAIPRLP